MTKDDMLFLERDMRKFMFRELPCWAAVVMVAGLLAGQGFLGVVGGGLMFTVGEVCTLPMWFWVRRRLRELS